MGPTSYIPHGKRLLGEDCSLRWKLSTPEVEGAAGFLTEGSPPSPLECGGLVSGGVRAHDPFNDWGGGGGDVTILSPFCKGAERKQPLPETCLTNPLVKCDEFGASLPTMYGIM